MGVDAALFTWRHSECPLPKNVKKFLPGKRNSPPHLWKFWIHTLDLEMQ